MGKSRRGLVSLRAINGQMRHATTAENHGLTVRDALVAPLLANGVLRKLDTLLVCVVQHTKPYTQLCGTAALTMMNTFS